MNRLSPSNALSFIDARLALKALLVATVLMLVANSAMAAPLSFRLPLVEDFACPFIKYFKDVVAPLIAAMVVVVTLVGWKLGFVKPWGTFFNVIMSLSILAIVFSAIANYSQGFAATCLGSV